MGIELPTMPDAMPPILVSQSVYHVKKENKKLLLTHVLQNELLKNVLIFTFSPSISTSYFCRTSFTSPEHALTAASWSAGLRAPAFTYREEMRDQRSPSKTLSSVALPAHSHPRWSTLRKSGRVPGCMTSLTGCMSRSSDKLICDTGNLGGV